MRKRFLRAWSPLVGPAFAVRLYRSNLPIVVAMFALVVSWFTGAMHAFSPSPVLAWANGLAPVVIVSALAVWPFLLRRRRVEMVRLIQESGTVVEEAPSLLTPTRLVAWSERNHIPLAVVRRALD